MVKVSTEDCHAAESGGEPGCERPHDVPPGAGVFDDDVERAALAQHPDPFELLHGADGEVEHDALVSEGSEGGDAHEQAKLHDEEDKWRALIYSKELSKPADLVRIVLVETLTSKSSREIVQVSSRMHTKLAHAGLPVHRVHTDSSVSHGLEAVLSCG